MAEDLESKIGLAPELPVAKSNTTRSISLKRIAFTTAGYLAAGSAFPNHDLMMPLCAAVGFGTSLYSELHDKSINLFYPAAGMFVGGLLGQMAGHEYQEIMGYLGAFAGGGAGVYKSYLARQGIF